MHLFLLLLTSFLHTSDTLDNRDTYANLKEAYLSQSQLLGKTGPAHVNWIDEGKRYSYTVEEDGRQQIYLYDPRKKQSTLLFDASDYAFPDRKEAFSYEEFKWSKDSEYLLFQANFRSIWRKSGISDYYLFDIQKNVLTLVVRDARTAELSPDGANIGYESDGNLYCLDLKTARTTQLTHDGSEALYNGRFGWAYEEEFGLPQAWIWSPDGKAIAFWQTEEAEVPVSQLTNYDQRHPDYEKIPYPKPGDPIPTVRVGVISIRDAVTRWMNVDTEGGYLPRLYWMSEENQLAVVHLNRRQNHLKLYKCNTKTGTAQLLMEEKSQEWLDVFFYTGGMHYFCFPPEEKEFFWISDRDGWNHIYRYDYDGRLISQVTKGEWEVQKIEGISYSQKRIYYKSTEHSPLESHLYSVGLNGEDKKQLTKTPGNHTIKLSPDCCYYFDSYSNVSLPWQVDWCSVDGVISHLERNDAVNSYIGSHFYAPKELFQFKTDDGQVLDGYLIRPRDFDPKKKYPLVLNVYGGPGSQFVVNEFATDIWEQYAAQEGFVIANVNNRGSGGYGARFKKQVYRQLGHWQSYDFVQAANYLSTFSWIDGDNMAIMGRSFGGFSSAFTMLSYPGVFKAAIVAAGVADWRLYDAIYTERYMDLLDFNPDGYAACSALNIADQLNGDMLLVHGAMDDNVQIQNCMQLLSALVKSGKDVELKVFPEGRHRIGYDVVSQSLVYAQYMDFLKKHLMNRYNNTECEKISN